MAGGLGYREAMRRFSRNAKLYLGYASLSGVNSSIFLVAFAFYLEEVFNPSGADPGAAVSLFGVPLLVPAFIGLALGVQALAHGANSLPSGLLGDRYGRRRSFVLASLMAVLAGVAILVTADPLFLLLLAVVVGMGEAFHGVVGGPFLMENSAPEERMHLFTLDAILSTASTIVGALLGAVLPGLFEGWILAAQPDLGPIAFGTARATALRLTLFLALPFGLIELVPIAFMKESYAAVRARFRDVLLLRHVERKVTVAQLCALSLLLAGGLGLYFPLLNLHLEEEFHVHTAEFGPIVAANQVAIAVATLAVPLLVARLGKVRTIVWTRFAAVPFLVAMGFVGDLFLVSLFFVLRGAIATLASPVVGAFSMEVVGERERATTAGFTHASFDLAYGGAVILGGLFLSWGLFWFGFALAGLLYLFHVVLWRQFFRRHPVELASREALEAVTE